MPADATRQTGVGPTVLIANPSPDVYGSDLQMLESVGALVEGGWRVVVAIPRDGALVPRLLQRGAEVDLVDFPVLRRANQSPWAFVMMLLAAAWSVPRIAWYVARRRPGLVYVNTVTLPWWILGARLGGARVVCHLHEAENTDGGLVQRALLSPLLFAHAVVVISTSVLDTMVSAVPRLRSKARLVRNGVPRPDSDPTPPSRDDPFRVTVVGRLSPRKAPHLALEAVALLRAEGRSVELELCGSIFEGYEWYEAELRERAAQPDLRDAVRFSGYTSPIWDALSRADVVVAPSLREPFGNAVVEAQLALRPVVATAALGHLESVQDGDTGLLVEPGDVEAMARQVARLMDDPVLAGSLADRAHAAAVERFGVERYARELCAVANEVSSSRDAR